MERLCLWHQQRRWFQPRAFWRFRLRLNGGVIPSSKLPDDEGEQPRQPANQPKTSQTLQVRYIFTPIASPRTTTPSYRYRHRCHHHASRRSSVGSYPFLSQAVYIQLAPAHLSNPGGQVTDSFTNNFQDNPNTHALTYSHPRPWESETGRMP